MSSIHQLVSPHELIKTICAQLFVAEERRLERVKEELIRSNKELFPARPHDGFTYQGKPYFPANLTRGTRVRVPLHNNLVERADAYLRDMEQVWTDRHLISQILASVLRPCETLQDVRDALPNCLVDTVEEVKKLSRMRDEAYTIQNDPRTVRQFAKILPRMEFYSTARLLY